MHRTGQTGVARQLQDHGSMSTQTIIIILLVVLLLSGGGFYLRGRG